MKGCKRINRFIKHNISRDINSTNGNVKTFDSFVDWTIFKKHTLFITECKLMCIVWTKVRPTKHN